MPASPTTEEVVPKVWSARLVLWLSKNTQFVMLLFLIVMIGGIYSLATLRREGFPNPSINIAVITDLYKGAGPEEVESQVIKPIEVSLQGIKGISEVRSTAGNSFGSVVVSFDASADFNAGLSEVRNKVQNVTLPKDADKPDISVPDIGGNVSYYAITKDDAASSTDLRAQGELVKREVESVPGVSSFTLTLPVTDTAEISWNMAKLAATGISPTDVPQAIQASNVTIPAGTIDLNDTVKSSVVTVAPLTSIDDLKNLIIGVNKNATPPTPVRLSDIATVTLKSTNSALLERVGLRDTSTSALTQPTAIIYQLKFSDTADIVRTEKNVAKRIDDLSASGDLNGAKVTAVYNVAEQINDQVSEIEKGAFGGPVGEGSFRYAGYALGAIWLIALSMFLFVSWRAALISALAVPLSLLITFLALKLQGITLNTLTLFSMVLVLALIVDPAIVLLESIQRELDLGKRGRNAVLAAMNTVGIGAFIAVICNVLVFVPFGVVSGIFGQIIRYIPVTVIPALLASYFVPLVFLTYLAQRYLKPKSTSVDDEEIANLWKSSQWFVRANTKILATRWMQAVIIILAIVIPLGITGALFATNKVVPVQFSSTSDSTMVTLKVEYPSNLTDAKKREYVVRAEDIIKEQPGIKNYATMMQDNGSITLFLTLFPRADRDKDADQMVKDMNAKLEKVQSPKDRVFMTAEVSGVGIPQSDPVAVNIFGDDLESLKKAAIKTGDILREQSVVTRVNDGFTDENNPQIAVSIDRAKLAATGLPPVVVAQTLAGIVGESTISKFEQPVAGANRSVDIMLVDATKPTTVDGIKNTVIAALPTGPVRIQDVAAVSETQGFAGIQRLDGQRFVTVSAKVKDPLKDAAGPQKAVTDFWTKDNLKQFGLREDALSDRGASDQFVRSFQDLFTALAIALVLLYAVLVMFFRSFAQPFIILFAIPLSFIGVFPALTLVGGQFGFLEILGIITLAGIAVNVGIFLINLANQRREEGMDYKQAIAEASGIRFRPIFLTKVTALGGLLPLIILSPFWRSLATVVLAGVLVSGVLSLFTTPILYSWFIGLKNRLARGFVRWENRRR